MSKKNVKIRIILLVILTVLFAIEIALIALVPEFQYLTYEIRDNQLVVIRENMCNTNLDVSLNVIDEKGNKRKETVKVYFEGNETKYTFDQEYFKEVLETEDDVHVIEVKTSLSNYTKPIDIILSILIVTIWLTFGFITLLILMIIL